MKDVNTELANKIYEAAIAGGYDDCGIISIDEMSGYKDSFYERLERVPEARGYYTKLEGMTRTKERYPWAKSVIICLTDLTKYRYPEHMVHRFTKNFFLSPEGKQDCEAYQKKMRFLDWLTAQGFKWDGGEKLGHPQIGGLRHAAAAAGIGIIRKNNFLYNENGSFVELDGYVIDAECTLHQEREFKPCPEKCDLCMRACPTGALCGVRALDPLRCLGWITTFGGGVLPAGCTEDRTREWICGCDECQDACPRNHRDWEQGEEFPGLKETEDFFTPERILAATDDELREIASPKTCGHIYPDKIETFRVNAARALRNREISTKEQHV